ncbi:hypothetical protein [Neobacillus vireti]
MAFNTLSALAIETICQKDKVRKRLLFYVFCCIF